MKQNINSIILTHFTGGTGAAASYIRYKLPDINTTLNTLFTTRSEIHRVQISEDLAEKILRLTDFSDLIPLRSEIATIEIKRQISYKKQTDHTVHTVYLFLLGVLFYDNLPSIRSVLDDHIHSKDPIKMFIFRWTFASLLHDVGYLFYEYHGLKNIFADMFEFKFIQKYAGELTSSSQISLQEIISKCFDEYPNRNIHETTTTLELLQNLNTIPWLKSLGYQTTAGLEVLASSKEMGKDINEFAVQMATIGYNGDPVADHGIIGGLMLLKYSSYWYYICEKARNQYPNLWKELTANFKYPIPVLIEHVIPACRAVAYHNMSGVKFNFKEEPLLYFSVLCDEIQTWDRFFSGSDYINNWRTVEHCMAEQITAELITSEMGDNRIFLITSSPICAKITNSLQERLIFWEQFVNISSS